MKIDLDEVYKKIAFETGLPKNKVELAFRSIFENVANTMREEKGDNILLPKFGKFVVPMFKLKYINKLLFPIVVFTSVSPVLQFYNGSRPLWKNS